MDKIRTFLDQSSIIPNVKNIYTVLTVTTIIVVAFLIPKFKK